MRQGLPERRDDWRLLEHAEGRSSPALRGTTGVASGPVNEGGAAYWAGEGGYVYEIRGVPTWNVNNNMEDRVPTDGGRFRGNLMHGENVYAGAAREDQALGCGEGGPARAALRGLAVRYSERRRAACGAAPADSLRQERVKHRSENCRLDVVTLAVQNAGLSTR
jgi:hypothetical protein